MHVILKKTMEKLGNVGDVIRVAEGFARNYLLPNGLAEESTPEKIAMIEALREKRRKELELEEAEVQILTEKLEHTSCTVTVQAGEEDKLYGSVTTADISKALAEGGINIPKKKIILEEPIKKLGIYNIHVKLAPEKTAMFKLWVVKE